MRNLIAPATGRATAPLAAHRMVLVACALAALVLSSSAAQAQRASRVVPAGAVADPRMALRVLGARRVTGASPAIDGRLDDAAWAGAEPATDFVASRPVQGGVPRLRTEARVVFNDEALYVAVRAYDPAPDSILAPYPRRDDEITSDWLFVEIDSRHDRRSAFSFGLNPRGVQCDGAWSNDVDYDGAWNAVWAGAARIDSLGWTAEYRIPFSQLALPARRDSAVTFGLNVYRTAPSRGETSNWSPRLLSIAGVVSHFNELRGIRLPRALQRAELVPYVAARAAHAPVPTGDPASAALPRGSATLAGADGRLRLTPALTLAATLHPDFGQVEADPAVVNLTTFETFFPEQRPFFVDGADRFAFNAVPSAVPNAASAAGLGLGFRIRDLSFANDAPFYSRRVGRPPHVEALGANAVTSAPAVTDILAAAKLTGRGEHGWSLGALAAVTDPESATLAADSAGSASRRALVEPRTLFGVARVARELRGGGNAVGGLITIVDRPSLRGDPGADPGRSALAGLLPSGAVLAGVDARHRFAIAGGGEDYELSAFAAASRVTGTREAIWTIEGDDAHALLRPDAAHLSGYAADTMRRVLDGASAQLRAAKLAGHWLGSVSAHVVSPGFADDDVGFQQSTDWLLALGTLSYQRYESGRLFRRWSLGLDQLGGGWSFGGERRAAAGLLSFESTLLNEWGAGARVGRELPALATEVLRGALAVRVPARTTWEGTVHTDSRRTTLATLVVRGRREDATGAATLALSPQLDARLSDRLRVRLAPRVERSEDALHRVGVSSDCTGAGVVPPCYIVGRLTQRTATLTLRADLAFSARTTLQLYTQALAGAAAYDRFATIVEPRAARPADRARPLDGPLPADVADPSFATRRLLLNAVWRWEYRPGSTLFVVFTQRRAGDESDARWNGAGAFRALSRDPAASVLMVKWSYFFTT